MAVGSETQNKDICDQPPSSELLVFLAQQAWSEFCQLPSWICKSSLSKLPVSYFAFVFNPSIPRETSSHLRQLLLGLLQRNHKDRMDFGKAPSTLSSAALSVPLALHKPLCFWLVLGEASRHLEGCMILGVLVYVLESQCWFQYNFVNRGGLARFQHVFVTCIPCPGFCFYHLSELWLSVLLGKMCLVYLCFSVTVSSQSCKLYSFTEQSSHYPLLLRVCCDNLSQEL